MARQIVALNHIQFGFRALGLKSIHFTTPPSSSWILTFLTVDKFGRRTIVISGGLLLVLCMLVIGSLYASDGVVRGRGAGRWVVIVLIFAFALACVSLLRALWARSMRARSDQRITQLLPMRLLKRWTL
jgi:hypothetical protein